MRIGIGHLRYFLADAMDEWRHSPGVNLLATATVSAVLLVAGLVLLVIDNLDLHLERWRNDLRVEVYLLDDVTEEARERIARRLSAMPEVARVTYVDKAEALERFREAFGEALAGLSAELESHPLPASFDVYLAERSEPSSAASSVSEVAAALDGVEEVRFDRDWLDRLDGALEVARLGGLAFAAVVLGAVVLVIASVLRLAVYARRDEIEIMQLVGATPAFIRGPFLVAGLVQGSVASLVSLVLVEVLRRGVLAWFRPGPGPLLEIVIGRPLSPDAWALVAALGLLVSLAGSYFAVRSFAD